MKAGQTSTPQGFLKDLLLFPFAPSQPAASVAMMRAGYCRRKTNTNVCTLGNILFLKKLLEEEYLPKCNYVKQSMF